MSDHHHRPAPRRILGIRFGKKQKPTDPKLENGKVGCCGHCVGAPRPGLPAGR